MTKTKSFNKNTKHKALYHALMESILQDEDAMDKGVADRLKKRNLDDVDKDEGPPAGPDQGLKRKKMGKDTEPLKQAKSTGTSKGTTKSQPKYTSKSAQAKKTVFEAGDTQVLQNLGEDMGNTDEPPVIKVVPKDWFKKPERPPTPDLKWNECKTVDRPVYKLLKGTCRSYVELEHNMEECYKALNDQLDWNNPEDYYSEDQYARDTIRRIQDIVCEYSGRYQVWSLLKEIPNTRRPAVYHYQGRDSDDDDYQDRDYDVSALANNLSQAFRYGISENDDNIEASGSLDRDDEPPPKMYYRRVEKGESSEQHTSTRTQPKVSIPEVTVKNSFDVLEEEDKEDELYTEHKHDDVLNVSDSEVDEEIMVEDRNGSFNSNATKPGASTPDNEENNLSICVILESHVVDSKLHRLCSLVFRHWDWASNGAWCNKGTRIIMGWNHNDVDVVVITQDDQAIHTRIWLKAERKEVFCSFIYAHNRPWCLLGNFNAALFLEDSTASGSSIDISMREFRDCVEDIEVMDVQRTGMQFTWSQKPKGMNGILKKLDHVMANLEFNDQFVGAHAIFKPYRIFDHSPSVLFVKGTWAHQKAKIQWFKEGDSNSAYFHKVVKSRVSRSRIDVVTNIEGVVFENNEVSDAFVSHYETFLGLAGETNSFNTANLFTKCLNEQVASGIVRNVTTQEVKEALFSIGDDKSPGPDGYTAAFFKEAWDVVANDVTNAICEFFRNGTLLKEINHTIIALIPKCVATTSYSICVNGSLHGYFKGKRGLRQGDPLSPYLFTLVMEVLTFMLQRKVKESDLFTYHRYCSKLELINLCFADDLFLFAYGDVHSASVIKEALDEFKGASGLVPSLPKSTAYFCNVLNHIKLSILQILPFEEGKLPVKYIGVPLVSSRLMFRDCNELIDRVQLRIQDWKNKFLSIAVRLQLLKLVLGSMHIYWASVFILPSRVLFNIEQLMRGFLWCHGSLKKGKSKVAWEVVCLPKDEGGLGIRRLECFNSALMVAHIWKLLSLKESLWVKWIHEYKLNRRNFWDIPLRGNMSWGWRKILQLRPIIREFIWCKIRDGASTSLWFDKWCDLGPLASRISSRDIFRAGLNLASKVKDITQNGTWLWPPDLLVKYHFLSECHAPIVEDNSDVLVCHNSQGLSNKFSVAQVWSDIHYLGTVCSLCGDQPDSHDHLFFECSFAHVIWDRMIVLVGLDSSPPNIYDIINDLLPIARRRSMKSVVAKLVVTASAYFIWQERNWRLFNKCNRTPTQIWCLMYKQSNDVEQEVAATVESMEKAARYTSNKYVKAALNSATVVLPYIVPIVLVDYFFNNDLAYLQGGSTSRPYTTSLTKTKAAKYNLQGIEDMVPNLSDQQLYKFMEGDFPQLYLNDIEDMLILVVQNKLFNLKDEDIMHLVVALRMFTRRIVIQKGVEDLQLGVKNYQKKLNISRLLTHKSGITDLEPYTTYSNPQGVIYLDKLERNRLMCSHELYKFSDGTLISVWDKLKDMLNNLEIGYTSVMPRRRWSNVDKKWSRIMMKDIDRQLLERRLMKSLGKFIGGREYEEDLRLLQRII
ncbi:RNA-directed DNA polymerase, eukaryota, reverse transcriptase zinc-binding domain protein [Tanacetum coccineum]|uniref:RNA-directed DNA polymerase, eukaryota, reverse transcriptase zinc-binding domain protein n=1 Tax=Tanacetum coccineum TaxID=301880 RepID=A0ABQ5DEX3_9ASTR